MNRRFALVLLLASITSALLPSVSVAETVTLVDNAEANHELRDLKIRRRRTKSPTGPKTKSPTGTKTKSPTGNKTKSPTGNKTKSPTGNKTKSPTGSKTKSPTGNKSKL